MQIILSHHCDFFLKLADAYVMAQESNITCSCVCFSSPGVSLYLFPYFKSLCISIAYGF